MNRRLFLTWHAVGAAAVVLGFAVWVIVRDLPLGRAVGYDRDFLLATGWASLGLFGIVFAHILRKYVHKLGVSPEFRMKVSIEDLEKAETVLNSIRRQVLGGTLTERSDILKAAKDALKRHKVHRILRIELREGELGGPPWHVLAFPTFPLGKMFHWMHAHTFYGLAAGILVLLHGGNALHPGIGGVLEGLALLVVVSGIIGAFLWATGPAVLTARERDLSTEKAFALERNLGRKVEAAFETVEASLLPDLRKLESAGSDFPERARETLGVVTMKAPTATGVKDLLALLGQRHAVQRELKALMRVRLRMHLWRVVHIPAAMVLVVFVAVHVASVFWY